MELNKKEDEELSDMANSAHGYNLSCLAFKYTVYTRCLRAPLDILITRVASNDIRLIEDWEPLTYNIMSITHTDQWYHPDYATYT